MMLDVFLCVGENWFGHSLWYHGDFCRYSTEYQEAFPDVTITCTVDQVQSVRVADGRPLHVTSVTCPVRSALHTKFGPLVLDLFCVGSLIWEGPCAHPGMTDARDIGSGHICQVDG